MIYNQEIETMPHDEIRQNQIEKLQSTLNRVYRNVAFYKNRFDEQKINIEDIKCIDDLTKLPFTTKDDLRKSYPYDMFAIPLKDVVRIHSSLGRTGKPIAVGYSKNDIKHWSELVARVLFSAGVTEEDFVQIAFDYSMVTGAFGFHYGAEKLGASVIPSSSNSDMKKQIVLMKDYKSSVLLSTPSYAMNLIATLKEMEIHPDKLNFKIGIFGAEPWDEEIRQEIENGLHIKAYNNYGVNDILGPGVAGECFYKSGLHINEDHFIVEIINPETLEPVSDGERGELVVTTITREGYPLIRYRTGDLSSFIKEECQCGRGFKKIDTVSSRTDDLIVVRGVNIFPAQIQSILNKFDFYSNGFVLQIDYFEGIDLMTLEIAVSQKMFTDEIKKLEVMKKNIEQQIKNSLDVSVEVKLVEPATLNETLKGDSFIVIDKR